MQSRAFEPTLGLKQNGNITLGGVGGRADITTSRRALMLILPAIDNTDPIR
jgi:hypothetical protein